MVSVPPLVTSCAAAMPHSTDAIAVATTSFLIDCLIKILPIVLKALPGTVRPLLNMLSQPCFCRGDKSISGTLGVTLMTTIFSARKIITMNPSRPQATHVAVRDGRILGAGTLKELAGWGDYTLDETFKDKVIMPGLVEGHSHAMEGTLWKYTYVGFFDRMDPHGKIWTGAKDIDAVIDRLVEADAQIEQDDAPLPAWSLDPIYFNNERVTREDLDRVSTTRPIGIMHASGHILNVNSKALEIAGLLKTGINNPGVPLGKDGLPTGELKGAGCDDPCRHTCRF